MPRSHLKLEFKHQTLRNKGHITVKESAWRGRESRGDRGDPAALRGEPGAYGPMPDGPRGHLSAAASAGPGYKSCGARAAGARTFRTDAGLGRAGPQAAVHLHEPLVDTCRAGTHTPRTALPSQRPTGKRSDLSASLSPGAGGFFHTKGQVSTRARVRSSVLYCPAGGRCPGRPVRCLSLSLLTRARSFARTL